MDMDLRIGDLIAFKKYEDMDNELKSIISKESFPKFGKVSIVYDSINCFEIEEGQYVFDQELIDYIIKKSTNERFVLQEDHYGMYVIDSKSLSLDKIQAKVYNSRNEANEDAADMHLNAWDVIPYE